jgi:outer membrane protein assembly factor BamE (lipoprotein component of BamABCDE complex)
MKKTILSAALTASFFMISCGSKTLAEVKPGMTEAEVKEMMGDPEWDQYKLKFIVYKR